MSKKKKKKIDEEILKHLSKITEKRDHILLEQSIVSAFYELVGATQARSLKLFVFRGEMYLLPRVSIKEGQVISSDGGSIPIHDREPLAHYPVLEDCIKRHLGRVMETNAAGENVLWFPIWIGEVATTCLEITNSVRFSESNIALMEGILCVYCNYQSLLNYSERDSLTGLLNRKTFDEKFFKMVSATSAVRTLASGSEADRRGHPASNEDWLAVVDIDHFKRVNDKFGHLYGDEVLILVANLLRLSFRTYDEVFRFGGEEFVIILREANSQIAHKVFERFRERVQKYDFPQAEKITVSLGFCRISFDTPLVILGRADQALYSAKDHGRNRICNYDELAQDRLFQSDTAPESVELFSIRDNLTIKS